MSEIVQLNSEAKLSEHFTLGEMTKSNSHPEVYNIPITGCAVDIRVLGMEQLIRYATILLDYADESKQDFDELLIERNRYGAIWLHFAVRPSSNRRKVNIINA